jgi:hypothetical protein
VLMLGQIRIIFAMSRDGLLPFRKRVKTCPESARCRVDVGPHRLVWVFPWRCTRCPRGAGLVWVSLGLVYRRPRKLGEDVPPADLVHELGEGAGGVEIAVRHQRALVAPVGPFG